MWSWGSGEFGELGNGKTENRYTPDKVLLEDYVEVSQVAGGKNHSCFVTVDGKMWVTGKGTQG